MWKLDVPQTHVRQLKKDLTEALTLKNGTPVYPITITEKNSVISVYDLYDSLKGIPNPSLLNTALADDLLDALEDAYGEVQLKRRLSDLRDRLLLGATLCPYCGFGEITDLDHHLPKSTYKGLAIYPKNLVPCCGPCNGKKRTVAGASAIGQFHHTYFGELPDDVFFGAEVDLSSEALVVKFSINQVPGMDSETYQRLHYQLERLELNSRYKEVINVFIGSLEVSLIDAFGTLDNATLVKEFLEKSASTNAKNFGKNDWRPILLKALAGSEDFCNGGFKKALGKVITGA